MNMLFDLTMQQLLYRICGYLLVAGVHGYVLATLCRLFGDDGPALDGRQTLNPAVHASFPAAALGALFIVSWIRPLNVDPTRFRFGRESVVGVILLALLITAALFPALGLARLLIAQYAPGTSGITALALLAVCQDFVFWFVAVNLIPWPPLTAGLIWNAILPGSRWLRLKQPTLQVLLIVATITGISVAAAAPIYSVLKQVSGTA
jgi:Zn-dependent protease